MTVFTYFDHPDLPFPALTTQLKIWMESWERFGFRTEILTELDAARHPDFRTYYKTVSRYPTHNPRRYEVACFVRWLALSKAGGGLMVDYDVINRGLRPEMLHFSMLSVVSLDATQCPAAVWAKDPRPLISAFGNAPLVRRLVVDGHVSDQTVFRSLTLPRFPVCSYLHQKLPTPLVHVATDSAAQLGLDKTEAMRMMATT